MGEERHVRLFRNGRSQAIRIPRDFELPGDEAIIRQEDGKLVIEPVRKRGLLALLDTLEPLPPDEQLPEIEDLPAEPFDFDFDLNDDQ
jgi:antitoxin VapB